MKYSFGLLNQIGFLVVFGKALLKTLGLCIDLCLHKEDVFIRFDIVAGSDAPPTTWQIVVLPEVIRGN